MAGSDVFFFLIVLIMASVLDGQTLGGPAHGKVVVCYVNTQAVYRTAPGNFIIEDLDPALCTHLVYTFAGLDENTNSIKSLDALQDLERDNGKAGYKRMVALKERHPHLKVTIAIGGWKEYSAKYTKMAADQDSRAKFIKSVLLFLDLYKFDGLDLCWEYPERKHSQPHETANYVALFKELKDAFEPRKYILTASLEVGKDMIEAAYDITKLSRSLDLIHMMCYGYHGPRDGVVGANAPLRGASGEDVLSVEYTIKYMLSQGVSPYKLVVGLPLYGRTFVLLNPDVRTVKFGRTAVDKYSFPGPLTNDTRFMGYNEICRELMNKSSNWTFHWHDQSQTPYIRDGDRVIAYDNSRSIANKVKLATDYGLGGFEVWSIDTDDFRGECHLDEDTFFDFEARARKLNYDPVQTKVLKNLHLPDAQHRLGKRSFYSVSKDRLQLHVPDDGYSNYNLMRTINEAAAISQEEKRITDEMDRISKENEIDNEPDSAAGVGVSVVTVMCCLFVVNLFL